MTSILLVYGITRGNRTDERSSTNDYLVLWLDTLLELLNHRLLLTQTQHTAGPGINTVDLPATKLHQTRNYSKHGHKFRAQTSQDPFGSRGKGCEYATETRLWDNDQAACLGNHHDTITVKVCVACQRISWDRSLARTSHGRVDWEPSMGDHQVSFYGPLCTQSSLNGPLPRQGEI
jgi:hypothetical protein